MCGILSFLAQRGIAAPHAGMQNVAQQRRILLRNGQEKLEMFKSRWIPFEEKYFSAFDVEKKADLVLVTD